MRGSVEFRDEHWNLHYRAVLDYVDEHDGNLPRPRTGEKYTFGGELLSVAEWMDYQIRRYSGNKHCTTLDSDKREKLEKIPAFQVRVGNLFVDDSFTARAVVYYCKHISTGRLPRHPVTWTFNDTGHTNITWNMTGRYCSSLKLKAKRGSLSDEVKLILNEVKPWVEWAGNPWTVKNQHFEFNARAVAHFFETNGRFPKKGVTWDFSHSGINATVSGRWWERQNARYRAQINPKKSSSMADGRDRQLDEWIGEPWKKWKDNEHIISVILRYKALQGDAWDGTVSESFVVPKEDEEGSEHWHKKVQGMELGQIARDISRGVTAVDDPNFRLKASGFMFLKIFPKRELGERSERRDWDILYSALLDYVETHDGKLPICTETVAYGGEKLELGMWIRDQVSRYYARKNHPAIDYDRREQLDKIPAFKMRVDNRLVDELFIVRAVDYCCKHVSNGRLPRNNVTWTFRDENYTKLERNLTGVSCSTLKRKFNLGSLSDEVKLALSEVKPWVEWAENPLKVDKRIFEFKSRAVAHFFGINGRFPVASDKWHFSHSGINATATGYWWDTQKMRYKKTISLDKFGQSSLQVLLLSDDSDRQMDEWIGEPWKKWKDNEHIISVILRYKALQGDAWDGTVSESFVVPKEDEEGSEHWHKKLQGMELGQIARDISRGVTAVDDHNFRLEASGFMFLKNTKRRRDR